MTNLLSFIVETAQKEGIYVLNKNTETRNKWNKCHSMQSTNVCVRAKKATEEEWKSQPAFMFMMNKTKHFNVKHTAYPHSYDAYAWFFFYFSIFVVVVEKCTWVCGVVCAAKRTEQGHKLAQQQGNEERLLSIRIEKKERKVEATENP